MQRIASWSGLYLRLALKALLRPRLAIDLVGCERGDEIITSVLTFSSDVAPLVQSGIVPAFVDVEPDTYQIDVERIGDMIGPRTKAIMTPNLVGIDRGLMQFRRQGMNRCRSFRSRL